MGLTWGPGSYLWALNGVLKVYSAMSKVYLYKDPRLNCQWFQPYADPPM